MGRPKSVMGEIEKSKCNLLGMDNDVLGKVDKKFVIVLYEL